MFLIISIQNINLVNYKLHFVTFEAPTAGTLKNTIM